MQRTPNRSPERSQLPTNAARVGRHVDGVPRELHYTGMPAAHLPDETGEPSRMPIEQPNRVNSEHLYYTDSFLKTFRATVIHARPAMGSDEGSLWEIALDRTAFYPTSGGQPFDTGLLLSKQGDDAVLRAAVEQVEEDEDGMVWHSTRQPLVAGTEVEGHIDWERRFDHMQQHTGQHLLSAVFLREFNAPTVSF